MKGSSRAKWSFVLGALAALTMPVAIFATRYSASYDLLQSGFAVPLAAGLGIAAIIMARQARVLDQVRLGVASRTKAARLGRMLGILGICLAASAAIALVVYGALVTLGG